MELLVPNEHDEAVLEFTDVVGFPINVELPLYGTLSRLFRNLSRELFKEVYVFSLL